MMDNFSHTETRYPAGYNQTMVVKVPKNLGEKDPTNKGVPWLKILVVIVGACVAYQLLNQHLTEQNKKYTN